MASLLNLRNGTSVAHARNLARGAEAASSN
jgi:hypothetical protein